MKRMPGRGRVGDLMTPLATTSDASLWLGGGGELAETGQGENKLPVSRRVVTKHFSHRILGWFVALQTATADRPSTRSPNKEQRTRENTS